jgi:hypothetical protein
MTLKGGNTGLEGTPRVLLVSETLQAENIEHWHRLGGSKLNWIWIVLLEVQERRKKFIFFLIEEICNYAKNNKSGEPTL